MTIKRLSQRSGLPRWLIAVMIFVTGLLIGRMLASLIGAPTI